MCSIRSWLGKLLHFSSVFLVIGSQVYGAIKFYSDGDYNVGIPMAIIVAGILLPTLLIHFNLSGGHPHGPGPLWFFVFILIDWLAIGLANGYGLYLLIRMSISEPKCGPLSLFIIDWIIIGGISFVATGIIMYFLPILIIRGGIDIGRSISERRKQNELKDMFEKALDPKFDASKFVESNNYELDHMPFTEKEERYLTQNFTEVLQVAPSTDYQEMKDCAIGLENFNLNDEYISHPVCEHMYHKAGLIKWFENSTICPKGKRATISSMILSLNERAKSAKKLKK